MLIASVENVPSGKPGAPLTPVGLDPGTGVVGRARVGAEEALTMISDKGRAVGFVDSKETLRVGAGRVGGVLPGGRDPDPEGGSVAGDGGGAEMPEEGVVGGREDGDVA